MKREKSKIVYASDIGQAAFCPHAMSLQKRKKSFFTGALKSSHEKKASSESRKAMAKGSVAHERLNRQLLDGKGKERVNQISQGSQPTNKAPIKSQESGKSACFIASYAFGENHQITNDLRAWRDNSLSKNAPGRAFIKFYYATSPKLICFFGKSSLFKKISIFIVRKIHSIVKAQ